MEDNRDNLKNDFENFIQNRLNNNYDRLNENKEYKELDAKYQEIFNKLLIDLSQNQKKELKQLEATRNLINAIECNFAYSLAFNDVITKLKNL